jgi:hypothetical protein
MAEKYPGSWMWPTPTARDWKDGSYCENVPVNGLLGRAVWPTPQDANNNGGPAQSSRNTPPLNARVGGQLNPTWVEWLMGFPTGWTDLEDSATR